MNALNKIAAGVVGLALVAGIAWFFRSDPIFMISGKQLAGQAAPYPQDWGFSDDYSTIAIETNPGDPHSVTTLCFVHEGILYVPAQGGSSKQWTQFVLDDPRVRLKVGKKIFHAKAERVMPLNILEFKDSLGSKYPKMKDRSPEEVPEDLWLFRIRPMIG
jgi:hypothetical protein